MYTHRTRRARGAAIIATANIDSASLPDFTTADDEN
jgi:hypothetical protein